MSASEIKECDPKEWQPRMLDLLDSLRTDFCMMLPNLNRQRFLTLMVLDQLEVQVRMGQIHHDEAVTSMINDLNSMASSLDGDKDRPQKLIKNITSLRTVYFEHPKDLASEIPHVILLGETGVGKSSLGNVFLGYDRFPVNQSAQAADTDTIIVQRGKWLGSGQEIVVIDAPGTNMSKEADKNLMDSMAEKLRILEYITTFTLVVNSAQCRLTDSHRRMIQLLQSVFGSDIFVNAVVVFTHWARDKSSIERRQAQGHTKENRARELNKVLRDEYQLDFNVPCFFMDSVEWQTNKSKEEHAKSLEEFFTRMKAQTPYHTIRIKDLKEQNQELHRLLHQLKQRLHEYKGCATQEELKQIQEAVTIIENEIEDQPHLQQDEGAQGNEGAKEEKGDKDKPQESKDEKKGPGKGSEHHEKKLKKGLKIWKTISAILKSLYVGLECAENFVPDKVKIYLKGVKVVAGFAAAAGDAIAGYFDEDEKKE